MDYKFISFDITNKCNLRCRHCYNADKYFYQMSSELNLENVYRAIDIFKKNGCEIINFLGGEPTIRESFKDIILYCRNNDIRVLFTTNGINLSLKNYEEYVKLGVEAIDVSLEGTKLYTDLIRGNGVYEKVVRNIKQISSKYPHNILRISCTLTSINYKCLEKFILDMNSNGINKFLIGIFMEVGNQNKYLSIINTENMYSSIEKAIYTTVKQSRDIIFYIDVRPKFSIYLREKYKANVEINEYYMKCAYKNGLRYVESNGTLHPCNVYMLNNAKGIDITEYKKLTTNILDINFLEKNKKLEKFFNESFEEKLKINKLKGTNEICNRCELRFKCQPCPFQFNDKIDYAECYYVDKKLRTDFNLGEDESIESPIKLILEGYKDV